MKAECRSHRPQLHRRLSHQTSCLEEAEASGASWKRLRSESFGEDTLQPIELSAGCTTCSTFPSFYERSLMSGWTSVMQMFLSHFYPCKQSLTHIPVSNRNSLVHQVGFGDICILVCHGFPIWGE